MAGWKLRQGVLLFDALSHEIDLPILVPALAALDEVERAPPRIWSARAALFATIVARSTGHGR